jgi:hypothetical protein
MRADASGRSVGGFGVDACGARALTIPGAKRAEQAHDITTPGRPVEKRRIVAVHAAEAAVNQRRDIDRIHAVELARDYL